MKGKSIEDFVKCNDGVWRCASAARTFEQAHAGIVEMRSHVTRGARLPYVEARRRGDAVIREEERAARLSSTGDDFPV